MRVIPERQSKRLLRDLSDFIGLRIHAMFRQAMPSNQEANRAHKSIRMCEQWPDICEACGTSAIRWVVKHRTLSNTATEQRQLAFNLTKRFFRECRKLRKTASPNDPVFQLYGSLDSLGFAECRNAMHTVSQPLIEKVTTPQSRCNDCRFLRQRKGRCISCRQQRCPVHCRCVLRSRKRNRKEINEHSGISIETVSGEKKEHR